MSIVKCKPYTTNNNHFTGQPTDVSQHLSIQLQNGGFIPLDAGVPSIMLLSFHKIHSYTTNEWQTDKRETNTTS